MKYYRPEGQQYVSQFIPAPIENMYAILEQKQKSYDDTMMAPLEINALASKLEPGFQTQDLANEVKNFYTTKATELANKFAETGDMSIARDIHTLKRNFISDPAIQKINMDREASKVFSERISKDPYADMSINKNLDPTTGRYKQVGYKDNRYEYEPNYISAQDTQKYVNEELKKFEADITSDPNFYIDKSTGVPLLVNKTTGLKSDLLENNLTKEKLTAISNNLIDPVTPTGKFFIADAERRGVPKDKMFEEAYSKVLNYYKPMQYRQETGNQYATQMSGDGSGGGGGDDTETYLTTLPKAGSSMISTRLFDDNGNEINVNESIDLHRKKAYNFYNQYKTIKNTNPNDPRLPELQEKIIQEQGIMKRDNLYKNKIKQTYFNQGTTESNLIKGIHDKQQNMIVELANEAGIKDDYVTSQLETIVDLIHAKDVFLGSIDVNELSNFVVPALKLNAADDKDLNEIIAVENFIQKYVKEVEKGDGVPRYYDLVNNKLNEVYEKGLVGENQIHKLELKKGYEHNDKAISNYNKVTAFLKDKVSNLNFNVDTDGKTIAGDFVVEKMTDSEGEDITGNLADYNKANLDIVGIEERYDGIPMLVIKGKFKDNKEHTFNLTPKNYAKSLEEFENSDMAQILREYGSDGERMLREWKYSTFADKIVTGFTFNDFDTDKPIYKVNEIQSKEGERRKFNVKDLSGSDVTVGEMINNMSTVYGPERANQLLLDQVKYYKEEDLNKINDKPFVTTSLGELMEDVSYALSVGKKIQKDTGMEFLKSSDKIAYSNEVSYPMVSPKMNKSLESLNRILPDDVSLTITSAYRDPELNNVVNGVYGSKHLTGDAIDVSVNNTGFMNWLDKPSGKKWLSDNSLTYIVHNVGSGKHIHIQTKN